MKLSKSILGDNIEKLFEKIKEKLKHQITLGLTFLWECHQTTNETYYQQLPRLVLPISLKVGARELLNHATGFYIQAI